MRILIKRQKYYYRMALIIFVIFTLFMIVIFLTMKRLSPIEQIKSSIQVFTLISVFLIALFVMLLTRVFDYDERIEDTKEEAKYAIKKILSDEKLSKKLIEGDIDLRKE